ncbi:MAG TPA: SUMF1/EgtB/PvdO family nonheme iron enzyme, partial [Phototrophicaceae bacterium]|nr:SUMF1/EgtB/PvdO family nonheme iron enzyme [Phototrophicaceae bacterium]
AQSATAVINPTGPIAGTEKVVRGGSWDAVPFFSRSVHRQSNDPASQTLWIGFRCAADAPTGQTAGQPAGTTNTQPSALSTLPPSSGNEEDTANSQPTLPPTAVIAPPPDTSAPTATLSPNG